MNLGGLESLGERQVRETWWGAASPTSSYLSRRPDEDHVVTAGGGDFERALDVLLPLTSLKSDRIGNAGGTDPRGSHVRVQLLAFH